MASERDKSDKSKINNQIKHIPKDAQVIMSILKEIGITDYEPRVINQLLEFTYRYVTCILDDAKVYANHAKKKIIDLDDVKLASTLLLDKTFTGPPTRDVLVELAKIRNNSPLPLIKSHCGLRLPPDRYCLSSCNYKLRAITQPKKLIKTALEPRSTIKTQIKPGIGNGSLIGQPSGKRQITTVPKTQAVSIPKPVFKYTTNKPATIKTPKIQVSAGDISDIKMDLGEESTTMKRKHSIDDFVEQL